MRNRKAKRIKIRYSFKYSTSSIYTCSANMSVSATVKPGPRASSVTALVEKGYGRLVDWADSHQLIRATELNSQLGCLLTAASAQPKIATENSFPVKRATWSLFLVLFCFCKLHLYMEIYPAHCWVQILHHVQLSPCVNRADHCLENSPREKFVVFIMALSNPNPSQYFAFHSFVDIADASKSM